MTQFVTSKKTACILLLANLGLSPAAAQPSGGPPPALRSLLDCQGLREDAARLACFDKAAAAFGAASQRGDVVVVDREQVRRAREEAFGFRLPSLALFGGDAEATEQSRVSTVKTVGVSADGGLQVVLADGAVWRQIDQRTLGRRPRPGSKAELRRGALNSYFLSLDGQPSIRARRVE